MCHKYSKFVLLLAKEYELAVATIDKRKRAQLSTAKT